MTPVRHHSDRPRATPATDLAARLEELAPMTRLLALPGGRVATRARAMARPRLRFSWSAFDAQAEAFRRLTAAYTAALASARTHGEAVRTG